MPSPHHPHPYFHPNPFDEETGLGGRNVTAVEGGKALLTCVVGNLGENLTVRSLVKMPAVLFSKGFFFCEFPLGRKVSFLLARKSIFSAFSRRSFSSGAISRRVPPLLDLLLSLDFLFDLRIGRARSFPTLPRQAGIRASQNFSCRKLRLAA